MIFAFADHELDEERFELRSLGVKVPVQPKVLDVLFVLVRNRDRVVLKRELLSAVWANVAVSEASISRAIMEARRAIGDDLQQSLLTVRGRGFRFALDVEERASAPPPESPRGGVQVDPALVGRDAVVAALDARLDDARAGHGCMVWLSGEAGIGKTRMLQELERLARARGARVLNARATEDSSAPPLWPIAQLLRAFAAAQPTPPRDLVEGATTITAGLMPAQSAGLFTFFDGFVRQLVSASRTSPIVVALDDLQWADDGTLRFLQFLAGELRDSSILIAGAYRDVVVVAEDDRARRLFGLASGHSSLLIPLRGLACGDIPRFVEVATGSAPTAAFTDAVFDRSGGNPLYLHQLLKTDWAERALSETAATLASSLDLQQGLIDSISRHVDALSEGARRFLTESAVLGTEFDLGRLTLVSDTPEREFLDHLDEALRGRILRKAKDGRYRFAHTLVREVLYKKLSASQRAERHAFIAERLHAHPEPLDAYLTEVATHFARALPGGDPARAIELSIRAAQRESSLAAHESAVRLWEQAAKALTFVRGRPDDRVCVELGRGASYLHVGREQDARDAFHDAMILARTFSSFERVAEAALGFARAASNDPKARAKALSLLAEAQELLSGATGDNVAALGAAINAARLACA